MKALAVLIQDFDGYESGEHFDVEQQLGAKYICSKDDQYIVIPEEAVRIYQAPGEIILQCHKCGSVLSIPFGSDHLRGPAGWIFVGSPTSETQEFCSAKCFEEFQKKLGDDLNSL